MKGKSKKKDLITEKYVLTYYLIHGIIIIEKSAAVNAERLP